MKIDDFFLLRFFCCDSFVNSCFLLHLLLSPSHSLLVVGLTLEVRPLSNELFLLDVLQFVKEAFCRFAHPPIESCVTFQSFGFNGGICGSSSFVEMRQEDLRLESLWPKSCE